MPGDVNNLDTVNTYFQPDETYFNNKKLKKILKRMKEFKSIFTSSDIKMFNYLFKKKNHSNFRIIKLACDDSQKSFFDGPNWK